MACFLGHYRDATRTLRYVNCGHNPPLLLRKGGAVERLAATGTVLGLFFDWECFTAAIQVQPEDVLCMYTDGITETTGKPRASRTPQGTDGCPETGRRDDVPHLFHCRLLCHNSLNSLTVSGAWLA